MRLLCLLGRGGDAPVPIAQTGSYAITTFAGSSIPLMSFSWLTHSASTASIPFSRISSGSPMQKTQLRPALEDHRQLARSAFDPKYVGTRSVGALRCLEQQQASMRPMIRHLVDRHRRQIRAAAGEVRI